MDQLPKEKYGLIVTDYARDITKNLRCESPQNNEYSRWEEFKEEFKKFLAFLRDGLLYIVCPAYLTFITTYTLLRGLGKG